MRSSEESRQEVARQLTGISHILQLIAQEANRDVKTEIERATSILNNIASCGPKRVPQFDSDCLGADAVPPDRRISLYTSSVVSREFPITDFTNVEVDCSFIFEISSGDDFRVVINAPESLFEFINVGKSGDTLKLSLKPMMFNRMPVLEAKIQMPVLNRLRQGAATKGVVTGFKTHDPLDLYLTGACALDLDVEVGEAKGEISGASHLTGDLKASKVDLELSGASGATLRGACNTLSLSAWGAADMDLSDLRADEGTINLKGASQATVRAAHRLDLDLTGASCLKYIGSPNLRQISLSGASLLSKMTDPA